MQISLGIQRVIKLINQRRKGSQSAGKFISLYIGLIFFISLLIYANSLKNGFTFDDHTMVENNLLIRSLSPRNIGEIFSTSWWWGGARQPSHEYRPLTVLSFAVYYHIAGLRPWFYHSVNIFLNAGVGVLVFLILLRLIKSTALALAIALLYALHPLHTEAVNSIVGEAELLSALFFLLGLWLFLLGRVLSPRPKWIVLSFSYLTYLLGLLSKEIAITLPLILALLHFFIYLEAGAKIKRTKKLTIVSFLIKEWIYYIGFWVALAIYFALRIHALGGLVSPTMGLTFLDNVLEKARLEKDYLTLYLTVVKIVGLYLWLLLFPLKLSADYSYDAVPLVKSLFSPAVLLTLVALGAGIAYAVFNYKQKKWIPLFGILFFFITFLPASNLFQLIGTTMGERLMYLPSLGFCLFVAYLLWQITAGRSAKFYPLIAAILIFFALRTYLRNLDWRDDFTLYKATVKTTPRCSRAHFNLANYYKERRMLKEAIEHYQRSWEIAPNYGAPLVGIGEILLQQGKLQEAEEIFRKVIKMEDRYHPAHHYLGMVLERMGRYEEAIAEYKRTIELRPTVPEPYHNIGALNLTRGNLAEAERFLQQALRIEPRLYISRTTLAEVYFLQKKWDKAKEELETAIRLQPQNPAGYYYLGKMHAGSGEKENALANLKQALALAPDNPEVHYELGKVYLVLVKDKRLAYEHLKRVLELNPEHPEKEKIRRALEQLATRAR